MYCHSPLRRSLCVIRRRGRGEKRKWVGYYGKMPFPSFHCRLGACYTLYTGTTMQAHWLGYTDITTTNLHISLNTQKISHQIKPPKEIPVSKISNPKESFDHPCQLKSGVKIRKKQDGNHQQATEYLPKCKRHTGKFVTHITKENCNKKMSFKNSSK